MTSAPHSLIETLLRAQSQFEKLINGASENTPATKFAEMAFMTAEVCILLSEAFAKSIEHRRENLLRALRAMAGIFRGLERASLETTSNSPNTLGTACGQCETAIYAFLEATEPDTQGEIEMSAAPWSGALAIGVGWAALDARLGKNTAHAHLAHQVILGLDGAVVVTTNSEIVAPTGKAIHIPAGQTHSIGPEGRLTRSIYIDPRFSGIRNDQQCNQPACLSDDLSAALEHISDINQARDWAKRFAGRLPGSAIDSRLQKALGNVRALANPAALARELALSPTRLREIVKADFGVPPSKLLQWLQLLGAAKAMEASSSLADAAAAGGFADQAHFTRRLQQWFGVTPKIGLSGLEVSVDDLS